MIQPLCETGSNLSEVWAKTFLQLMASPSGQRHPALITVNGLDQSDQIEDAAIRDRVDRALKSFNLSSCRTVAGTIFPRSMWNPDLDNDARALFDRYNKAWPGIKKCPANKLGVYFRRLTAYNEGVNQLQFIGDTYHRGNHRKSALQAAILDPTKDHKDNRIRGFPCMQQVSFTPLGKGALSVTGYYGMQYQFEKAYGNYLGLYHLGQFMAKQLNLTLSQVVCVASTLSLGNESKQDLRPFAKDVEELVNERAQA